MKNLEKFCDPIRNQHPKISDKRIEKINSINRLQMLKTDLLTIAMKVQNSTSDQHENFSERYFRTTLLN